MPTTSSRGLFGNRLQVAAVVESHVFCRYSMCVLLGETFRSFALMLCVVLLV